MDDVYLFKHFTVNNWVTLIIAIWIAAIVWSAVICTVTRSARFKRGNKVDREIPGFCLFGCVVFGIADGVCAMNLIMNTLRIDLGFATIIVLFVTAGIVGGTSYQIGKWLMNR